MEVYSEPGRGCMARRFAGGANFIAWWKTLMTQIIPTRAKLSVSHVHCYEVLGFRGQGRSWGSEAKGGLICCQARPAVLIGLVTPAAAVC
jgi:hypothetical protein